MLTTKPSDNDRPKPASRSGHGAASVIPHLKDEGLRPRSEGAEDPATENLESQAGFEPDAAAQRPDTRRP